MKGMASLIRNTLVFYNYFSFEESKPLTAVVALPFTPKIIN
jgi:hypothetical protein